MRNDLLKNARERLGLSQKKMADKLGMSVQRYNHYETGKREPNFETVKKIADYVGYDPSVFYSETEHFGVRFEMSKEQYDFLHALADKKGVTISEYMANLSLDEDYRKELEEVFPKLFSMGKMDVRMYPVESDNQKDPPK